jgi:hypothetical protein
MAARLLASVRPPKAHPRHIIRNMPHAQGWQAHPVAVRLGRLSAKGLTSRAWERVRKLFHDGPGGEGEATVLGDRGRRTPWPGVPHRSTAVVGYGAASDCPAGCHFVLSRPGWEPVWAICKQGVRGSSPLGSTAGHRPFPLVGTCQAAAAMASATTVASSPAPRKSADFRLRRRWTPTKCSPGATVLVPSRCTGNPLSSNAPGTSTHEL